jgi:CBS domain-containing protein
MQLKDVMTRDVEVVAPDATLQEAAAKMDALDVGPLPVCDGDRVLGMITDRDITVRAVAQGQDPKVARVADFMSRDLVYVFEDQDVGEAARLMQEKQIRRVLVLSRDKRLVGIVSLGDVAVETGDDRLTAATLEEISEPDAPDR